MFDGLTLKLLSDASAWLVTAVVCLTVVRLIYTGKLIPAAIFAMQAEALRAEREANRELRAALAEYQATGHATVHLLKSIQDSPESGVDQ